MKGMIYLGFLFLLLGACDKTINQQKTEKGDSIDSLMPQEAFPILDTPITAMDSVEAEDELLPIQGPISRDNLRAYYPGVTDTIKDLRIVGSEKIELTPGKGILVSILHNTGSFDQMILCTHDSHLNLLDHFYIGKATQFDGKSHTIEYEFLSSNSIRFDQVDYGFVNKDGEEEIDTVKYETYVLGVNDEGKIHKR